MKKQLIGWVAGIRVWGAVLGMGGGPVAWGAQDVTPPTAPVIITATPAPNLARIKLTWAASVDETPPGSMVYCIRVAENLPDNEEGWVQDAEIFCVVGVTSHVLKETYGSDGILRPLEPGTAYFIRIQAFDSVANASPPSEHVSVTTSLVVTLSGVTSVEAAYIRDVLTRDVAPGNPTWARTRNGGLTDKPLVHVDYKFLTLTPVDGGGWIVDGTLSSKFTLQGVLVADDCCRSWVRADQLTVQYIPPGKLTFRIWPVASGESYYGGKIKEVTGFSRVSSHDSTGVDGIWGSSTSFEQTTKTTASLVFHGFPYYLLPYLTVERTNAGSVAVLMGHRWYSEVELTEVPVTGLNQTDVTMTYKKKKRKLFSTSTKTKTVHTSTLEPFNANMTTKSAGSGLWALLSIDTSRPKMNVANPGKIFPDWQPMHAILSADLDWSVTVDTSPLQLFISDHGFTSGPALEGRAFLFDRWYYHDGHYHPGTQVSGYKTFYFSDFSATNGWPGSEVIYHGVQIWPPLMPIQQWTVAPAGEWYWGPGAPWLVAWLNSVGMAPEPSPGCGSCYGANAGITFTKTCNTVAFAISGESGPRSENLVESRNGNRITGVCGTVTYADSGRRYCVEVKVRWGVFCISSVDGIARR